jgi:uncharacterized coiled-coil protein SlyX
MTITVELPENKKEAAFVLQLLQKLNLVIKEQEPVVDELSDELKELLEERLADIDAHPENEMSLEAFEKKYYQTVIA